MTRTIIRGSSSGFTVECKDCGQPVGYAGHVHTCTPIAVQIQLILSDLRTIRDGTDWPLRSELNRVCDRLDVLGSDIAQSIRNREVK